MPTCTFEVLCSHIPDQNWTKVQRPTDHVKINNYHPWLICGDGTDDHLKNKPFLSYKRYISV